MSRIRVAALACAALMATTAAADARTTTTDKQTIGDSDRDNRLNPEAGDAFLVREELGKARPMRQRTRRSQIFFGQFTDTHVVDEESPARVEFLDKYGPPFTSAYRTQEAMSTQVMNEMVEQIRNVQSPITGRTLELLMTTGDNSDNTQRNETKWMIDLLDGETTINPDSGIEGSCGTTPDDKRYDGVRGGNEYYEPDTSGPPGANEIDGPGYSPDQAENEREAQRTSEVRDYPDLFEAAQKPFEATGLDIPWYGIFGNHDALVQGNQPRNDAFNQIAVGCEKPSKLSPTADAAVRALGSGPDALQRGLRIALADVADGGASTTVVPQDPDRRLLKKSEYIAAHLENPEGEPYGHGFTADNVASGMGNYAFSPKAGLRFVVLDSIAENGGDGGNIDDDQFRWLHAQLVEAETKRQVVMVFAHHSLQTMEQTPFSPFPPGDQGGNMSPAVHFGFGQEEGSGECALKDPLLPPTPDESLHCLFLRHRSVVAFVNGHEHNNRIEPFERSRGRGQADGGFWEINTAAHIDWPEQSRVLELMDNRDGTLSIFGTLIDHAAAPNPGSGEGYGVSRLASISRELSYQDPDSSNGEDGHGDARGGDGDRNVELVVKSPY